MRRTKRLNHKKTKAKDKMKRKINPVRQIKKRKNLKKTPRKRAIKASARKEDSPKYIGLLNLALNIMGVEDVFTEDDSVLERSWSRTGSFLEEGIKQGLLLLEDYNNDKLDPDCNKVCLTNALIVWQILEKVKYSDKLSPNEELYLLCLYYLNRGSNQGDNKVLPLEYALLGIENKLDHAKKTYEEKVANKAQAKKIKKAKNYVEKLQNNKDEIEKKYTDHDPQWKNITAREAVGDMDSSDEGGGDEDTFWWHNVKTGEITHMDKPWSPELWEGKDDKREQIDVCRAVDCQYLFDSWAQKSPEMKKSVEKLCGNIVSIYKGLTFTLIKQFAEEEIYQYQLESDPTISETKIELDLEIFSLLENIDFVLIPDGPIICELSEEYEEDIDKAEWVYTNLYKGGDGHYTMDRTLVSELKDKSYLVGRLDSSRISQLKEYAGSASDIIDFCVGEPTERIVHPMLTHIDLTKKHLLDGTEIVDISEHITDTITNHWFIADKSYISDRVYHIVDQWSPSIYEAMYM